MDKMLLCGGKLITPDGILEDHCLYLVDGMIADILPEQTRRVDDAMVMDVRGKYIAPGFVDIHQHGGGGGDYRDGTPEAYRKALLTHLTHGTTSILPTLVSADVDDTICAARQYARFVRNEKTQVNLLGLHLEGPFLSAQQAGAINPDCIRDFCETEYTAVYDASEGLLKRWSVAPELAGAQQFAEFARKHDIVLSIAHSDADFDTALKAYDWGFHHVTHLYSGMSTVSRQGGFRRAGVLEAAFYLDDMNVEIIADGCHLPESLLKFVTKFKKWDRISLITDAMRAAGQNVRESTLGSGKEAMKVIIEDGVAKLPSREAFAGSIATADRLVRTMLSVGIPLSESVRMASEYPLRMMEIKSKKGQIRKGFDADLCVFDEKIQVTDVIVSGKICYNNGELIV